MEVCSTSREKERRNIGEMGSGMVEEGDVRRNRGIASKMEKLEIIPCRRRAAILLPQPQQLNRASQIEALPGGGLKEAAIKLEEIAAYVDKRAEYADSLLDAKPPSSSSSVIPFTSIDRKISRRQASVAASGINGAGE
ncbi:hypothetical protein KSP40_PGU019438 [Platanthera guangdongensis]|uniref:Uncharacterized protein n=1 Tax=Platanthera guangdongensis TaxID=2320717 RepID=A0ABR2MRT0_9ASPA